LSNGGIGGDADFPGDAVGRVAGEGDDVGDAWISEKVGMDPGQAGIGEEREGKLAGRAATEKFPGVGVEGADERGGRAAVGAQPGMAVVNGDDAHLRRNREPDNFYTVLTTNAH
jgi:hypothetical protein